jgi:hypothetical protein
MDIHESGAAIFLIATSLVACGGSSASTGGQETRAIAPHGGTPEAGTSAGGEASSTPSTKPPASRAAVNALVPYMTEPSGGCPGDGGTPGYCEFFQYVAPHVNGISTFLIWGEIDSGSTPCVEGSKDNPCNWASYDAQLAKYVAAGLEVNLIVIGVNEGGTSNEATPAYVFTPSYAESLGAAPQDMATCNLWPGGHSSPVHGSKTVSGVWNHDSCYSTAGSCSGSSDTNGFPVVYEKPYLTAYQGFIANVLQHYSARGSGAGPQLASHIGYARFGMTAGGENQLFCNEVWPGPKGLATEPMSFSKDTYLGSMTDPSSGYISSMVSWIHSKDPSVGVLINTHSGPPADTDLTYADIEAQLAVANHVGIGMEAFGIGDAYEHAQGKPCTDDWCANFEQSAGAGVPLVLQNTLPTTQPSFSIASIDASGKTATATCTTACNFYTGNSAWVQISGNSAADFNETFEVIGTTSTAFAFASTSSASGTGGTVLSPDYLPITVPFAVAEHATGLEIYLCDLLYAFDPHPVTGVSCSTPPGSYSAKYAATIRDVSGR